MAVDNAVRACSRWPNAAHTACPGRGGSGTGAGACRVFGQDEGLAVGGFGLFSLRGFPMRGNLAEEVERIGLVAPCLVRTRQLQDAYGKRLLLLRREVTECREAEEHRKAGPSIVVMVCSSVDVSSGTASCARPPSAYAAPKAAATAGDVAGTGRFLTTAHRLFKPGKCLGQVALPEGQQTEPVIGQQEARRMRHRLGNLEPFLPQGPALGERPEFGMTLREPSPGRTPPAGETCPKRS